MDIYSTEDSSQFPCDWKITHFAHIGGNEEFVAQLVMEMLELVDASMIHGAERDKLKEAIAAISIQGLMPAFESLKRIRESTTERMPELNRKQLYESFSRELWHAYKDLTQKAAKMLDPEIGFLFDKQTKFEAGLAAFVTRWSRLAQTNVSDYLRQNRAAWQNDLADFRNNYLEHKDDHDPAVYEPRYKPEHAERLFDQVWRLIADLLAMLISFHLPAGAALVEIPPEQRSRIVPRRFGFAVRGINA